MYKMNFSQVIMSVTHADYRGVGMNDLIICTKTGEGKKKTIGGIYEVLNLIDAISLTVKGYEKSKVNLSAMKPIDQELIKDLMATKKNLLLELSHYTANAKLNKENLE